jgi:hypothetical protein
MLAGSVVKALTGQNVAGTEDLIVLSELIYRDILPKIGVSVSPGIRQKLARGEVAIQELEITAHSVLRGQQEVICALQALRLYLLLKETGREAIGDETVYVDKSSKVKSLKFYNKWLQMLATGDVSWESREFIKWAIGSLLRVELCLKAKWFYGPCAGMNKVAAWNPEIAHTLLLQEIEKLGLGEARVAYGGEPLEGVSALNNLVLALYRLGMPLAGYGGTTWLRQRRDAILGAGGPDIKMPVAAVEKMAELFDLQKIVQNLAFGQPHWAATRDLIPKRKPIQRVAEQDWVALT